MSLREYHTGDESRFPTIHTRLLPCLSTRGNGDNGTQVRHVLHDERREKTLVTGKETPVETSLSLRKNHKPRGSEWVIMYWVGVTRRGKEIL